MKMVQGTGTVSNYGNYTRNCTLGQLPYKIPINSLSDVQLYINIGTVKPTTIQYDLIHTCGPLGGTIESLVSNTYVVGQKPDNSWYGVFKDFVGASPACFVIAITLDGVIFFSDEYCIEDCNLPTEIQGCYGNLDADLSIDCMGVYFGLHSGIAEPIGDTTVKYRHKVFLRGVEVTIQAIRNSYKQGRTRTFRTEKDKLYQLWSEIVPEWYLEYVDAVFYRGEVNVGNTTYLLNETAYEKVDECLKQWKPVATFKESCFQSFSCEESPCATPPEECCDPTFQTATVDTVEDDDQSSGYPDTPGGTEPTIVIHSAIGITTVVTGTSNPVTGLTAGSSVVSCADFAGVRVFVMRGQLALPGVNPMNGDSYYTKNLADAFITFSDPLVANEFIYIETIPD